MVYETDKKVKKQLVRLKPKTDQLCQESPIKAKLYPHQKDFLTKATNWENQGHGGLLGAEMGTGKTLMILSLFATRQNKVTKTPKRTLIVAPLALLQNWKNEYQKHLNLPTAKVAIYHGKKRHQIPLEDRYMVITSYETVRQDIVRWSYNSPLVQSFKPERIVLDEAHEIKNQLSQRFQALLELPGRLCWAITGTPIQNYRQDLESLSSFIGLAPYSCPEWWQTHSTRADLEQWKNDSYIYFSKEDIDLSLPERYFNHHQLDFDDAERELYNKMKADAQEIFEEYLDGGYGTQFGMILVKILRLKQICNHPYVPLNNEQKKDLPFRESSKTMKLNQIIGDIPSSEKIIVFSQFRESLHLIQDSLDRNGYKDGHLIYHGGMSPQDKEDVLRSFNNDDSKRILLMSIKAGGVGLNLVRANHIVLFDPWWNRAIEEQALARVHRIGQTREVHIHRLSIKSSIEQWVISLQEHKLEMANKILDSDVPYDEKPNFSREDLKKLFRENCF